MPRSKPTFAHDYLFTFLVNFDQMFDKIFGRAFDQIFGQAFDQGFREGKNNKCSVQYYPASGKTSKDHKSTAKPLQL